MEQFDQWLKCKIRRWGTLHSGLGPWQWSCASPYSIITVWGGGTLWGINWRWGTAFPCIPLHFNHWVRQFSGREFQSRSSNRETTSSSVRVVRRNWQKLPVYNFLIPLYHRCGAVNLLSNSIRQMENKTEAGLDSEERSGLLICLSRNRVQNTDILNDF